MPYKDTIKRKEYQASYNKEWYQKEKKKNKLTCKYCSNTFTSRYKKQKFCSLACYGKHTKELNSVTCIVCGKKILAPPSKKRKYCSKKCSGEATRGIPKNTDLNKENEKWYQAFKEGLAERDQSTLVATLKKERGSKNRNWKGNKAGYKAVHMWVGNNIKKVGACANCGNVGKTEFSNIDHKYSRKVGDWQELCPRCHAEYDKKENLRFISNLT
jgi:hypothetical protein